VSACPFGVLDQREGDGRVWKCTLCYDRTKDGLEPACAQACPTDSIQYGPLDELREKANGRLEMLVEAGVADARLYGADEEEYGMGAFFLLLDDPEVYGLPPAPQVVTREFKSLWAPAAVAAATLAAGVLAAFAGGSR
ncbi:MAG: 4Fe-4S ferredoxin, partial [Actinomycetota bacterium]|nr:4Fe-4S ferredoxin [Actinomycetota bacterium]